MHRALLAAALLLLTGCAATTTPSQPPRPTVTTTRPVVSDYIDNNMRAVNSYFVSCGLAQPPVGTAPGAPPCRWDPLRSLLTELTGDFRESIANSSHPDGYSSLKAAVTGLETATTAFAPCAEWLETLAAPNAGQCGATWYQMTVSWVALKSAADWR